MSRNARVMGDHVDFGGCCNIFGRKCTSFWLLRPKIDFGTK